MNVIGRILGIGLIGSLVGCSLFQPQVKPTMPVSPEIVRQEVQGLSCFDDENLAKLNAYIIELRYQIRKMQ